MEYSSVLEYLRKICSMREYCRKDIIEKAVKRLDSMDDALRAADRMEEEGYLSEDRYARAFARDKATLSGWGPVKIRFALQSKGVKRESIEAAIREVDGSEASAKMMKVLDAKARTLEGDPQMRLKLLKFALSRGYDYESVKPAVEKISSRALPCDP